MIVKTNAESVGQHLFFNKCGQCKASEQRKAINL